MSRIIPQDLDAERALIGSALISDHALTVAMQAVTPDDFYAPDHQAFWSALGDIHSRHERPDVVLLADRVGRVVDDPLVKLNALMNATPATSNAPRYARAVLDAATRRRIILAAADATQAAFETDAGNALDVAREAFGRIDLGDVRGAPSPDIDTFAAGVDTAYDWIIPHVLERGDRMLVTAGEGGGKSTLLRQLAVMAAAGIHWWAPSHRIPPVNVLIVDCENGARLINRKLTAMRDRLQVRLDPMRLRIEARPEGINLHDRADFMWLMDRVRVNQPDLLVIGPVYKLHAGAAARGDVGGEDQARTVVKALDRIRDMGVTLLMETHAPHGSGISGYRDLRPFGSSVWLRWPEFGVGIQPADGDDRREYNLRHWRGPRDERLWPVALVRDASRWPWTPRMDEAEMAHYGYGRVA